jgi:ArsR family transcriptional regulator
MGEKQLNVIKALADATRLSILQKVLREGEISCQDLSANFDLAQPTMSHHIGKLIDADVISVRKEGVAHFYSVNQSLLKALGINPAKLLI